MTTPPQYDQATDRKIDLLHESLNERLALKDRWITSQFEASKDLTHARFDALTTRIEDLKQALAEDFHAAEERTRLALKAAEGTHKAIDARIDAVTEKQRSDDQTLREWLMARFALIEQGHAASEESRRREHTLVTQAHMDLHNINERALDEFKASVQQRLDAVVKTVDTLREERALFVLRDAHDTQLDAVEKVVDNLERTFNEKIDVGMKQMNEKSDTRIATNAERIQKIEGNLSVMNARNQQSIIALGILLTLVELIIRYYQSK